MKISAANLYQQGGRASTLRAIDCQQATQCETSRRLPGLSDSPAKIKDWVPLEPFALRPLERLAIYMRGLRPDELQSLHEGRALYNDTPNVVGTRVQRHEAATNRLRRSSVLKVHVAAYTLHCPGMKWWICNMIMGFFKQWSVRALLL